MKRQRGQALILVLILLAVGSLVIVPVLQFTNTGLRSQRISEDAMTTQYAADAAVEDALWQMLNGALGTLNPENPEQTYEVEFDFGRFPYSIQIPTVPESEWTKFQQIEVKVEIQPNWVEADPVEEPVFQYIFRIYMPQWDISNFGFTLPPGIVYDSVSTLYIGPEKHTELDPNASVEGSRVQLKNGDWVEMAPGDYVEVTEPPEGGFDPETAYLLIDGQSLEWMPYFIDPKTGNPPTGKKVLIQTCQVRGYPVGWGIHYVEPSFTGNFGTLETGQTGALGVAMYNILMDVEGVTYQVVVAYDSTTGEMKIISYQIAE